MPYIRIATSVFKLILTLQLFGVAFAQLIDRTTVNNRARVFDLDKTRFNGKQSHGVIRV